MCNQPGCHNTGTGSNLGHTYTCPAGQPGSTACKNYLAGERHFQVSDYEVFLICAAD